MAVAKTKQITELLVQNFGNYSMEIKVNYLDNLRIE
ncbi:MAG: hypothetical protein ACI9YH_005147, partial [Colwellia sp.]